MLLRETSDKIIAILKLVAAYYKGGQDKVTPEDDKFLEGVVLPKILNSLVSEDDFKDLGNGYTQCMTCASVIPLDDTARKETDNEIAKKVFLKWWDGFVDPNMHKDGFFYRVKSCYLRWLDKEDKSNRCSFCGYKPCQCAEITKRKLLHWWSEYKVRNGSTSKQRVLIHDAIAWLNKEGK